MHKLESKIAEISVVSGIQEDLAILAFTDIMKARIKVPSVADGRYIFQPWNTTTFISICDLKEKKNGFQHVVFKFPQNKAFCHVKADYYLAGGQIHKKITDNAWRLSVRAEITKLSSMPVMKICFPMAYFEAKEALITLGGNSG